MIKKQVIQMPGVPRWHVQEECGYEPKTTFWEDFWIAVRCGGERAVRSTYRRALRAWGSSCEYVTELVLVLNHMGWALWRVNEGLARVFFTLWEELNARCWETLEGEELEYFARVTD